MTEEQELLGFLEDLSLTQKETRPPPNDPSHGDIYRIRYYDSNGELHRNYGPALIALLKHGAKMEVYYTHGSLDKGEAYIHKLMLWKSRNEKVL